MAITIDYMFQSSVRINVGPNRVAMAAVLGLVGRFNPP